MVDTAAISAALKIITPYKQLMHLWYEDQEFLKWLPKRTDFYGRSMEVPIGYGPGDGGSHTFSDAQANESDGNLYDHFTITRARDYALLYIDSEAIEASENNQGAFVEQMKDQIDGRMITLRQQMGRDLQGNGGGAQAKIASAGISGNVITLDDPDSIVGLEVGNRLVASTADGRTGSIKTGSPGYVTITKRDSVNGKITVDNVANINGLAAGDFLFKKGNFGLAVKGLEAYFPDDSDFASNGTLWGFDRSADRVRNAGLYFDATSYSLPEGIERALAVARREGCMIDALWINHTKFAELSLELGAKAVRETVKVGEFAYDAIMVYSAGKKIPVLADQNFKSTSGYGLNRNSLCLHTLKEAPRFLTPAGQKSIVKPSADGLEARLGWRGNFICRAPGLNLRIQFAA